MSFDYGIWLPCAGAAWGAVMFKLALRDERRRAQVVAESRTTARSPSAPTNACLHCGLDPCLHADVGGGLPQQPHPKWVDMTVWEQEEALLAQAGESRRCNTCGKSDPHCTCPPHVRYRSHPFL